MIKRASFPAVAAAIVLATAPAAAAPAPGALPAPAVIRFPDAAVRTTLPVDANAPLARGEFATSVRIASDRAALRASIERERAAQAARFAQGAGPGIVVRLRRSRY